VKRRPQITGISGGLIGTLRLRKQRQESDGLTITMAGGEELESRELL